jgi:hypothetical protein
LALYPVLIYMYIYMYMNIYIYIYMFILALYPVLKENRAQQGQYHEITMVGSNLGTIPGSKFGTGQQGLLLWYCVALFVFEY